MWGLPTQFPEAPLLAVHIEPIMEARHLLKKYLFERNYYLAKAGCHFVYKWSLLHNQPLLIYQMGKVASTSVENSISDNLSSMPLLRFHNLSEDALNREVDNYYFPRSGFNRKLRNVFPEHLFISYFVRDFIRRKFNHNKRKWKIITLVRDPIARNISGFFQGITLRIPDFYDRINTISYEELYSAFIDRYQHDTPLVWFDLELKPFFGIDVYSEPFPEEKGYKIYSNATTELLLLKAEELNYCFSNAMWDFLSVKDICLKSTNQASQKIYSNIYKQFIERIVLPQWYIDKMYESKLVRHFYSEREIQSFISKWQSSGNVNILKIGKAL